MQGFHPGWALPSSVQSRGTSPMASWLLSRSGRGSLSARLLVSAHHSGVHNTFNLI